MEARARSPESRRRKGRIINFPNPIPSDGALWLTQLASLDRKPFLTAIYSFSCIPQGEPYQSFSTNAGSGFLLLFFKLFKKEKQRNFDSAERRFSIMSPSESLNPPEHADTRQRWQTPRSPEVAGGRNLGHGGGEMSVVSRSPGSRLFRSLRHVCRCSILVMLD